MPKFTIHHAAFATTTGLKTVCRLAPASGIPLELVYLMVSGSGSVAPNATDLQHEFNVNYLSGAGAGAYTPSTYTPEKSWQASRVAQGTYNVNATSEPTAYSANPFLFGGFNQRNGMAWGMPEGQAFKADAAAVPANMGVRIKSSLAHVIDFNAHVIEP